LDFAQDQRRPGKHLLGISIVVLMHVLLVYALVNGLARRIVEVIKPPIETKIIEEVKEKPPEPPPPPPKLNIPPPPFIPPPEINIQAPANAVNTITTKTSTPPPAKVVTPTPPPAAPAVRRNPTPTFKVAPAYPRKAIKDNIEGMVEAHLSVNGNGDVTEVKINKSVPRGMFDEAAIAALSQYKFKGDGTNWVGIVEINFKLSD
jgi:protein TonB